MLKFFRNDSENLVVTENLVVVENVAIDEFKSLVHRFEQSETYYKELEKVVQKLREENEELRQALGENYKSL
jgi:hypothetical protein